MLAPRKPNRQAKGAKMWCTPFAKNERYQIFSLLNAGLAKTATARRLGRNCSTIYRELLCKVVFVPTTAG